ncbi:RNA polymerase I-specific transcription initiation factor RRN3, partial [Aureobasidium melanogenum]
MPPSLPQKSLKRDASHLSSPAPESSQSKKLRVAFDDRVDVRIMDDWTAKPLDLVKDEVRSALEGHLRTGADKDDGAYEQLRMIFISAQPSRSHDSGPVSSHTEAPSTATLKKYLVALSGRVSDLKACGKLVHAVLDVNWLGRDDAFVALYVRFLGTLGSAVPGFLRTVLDRIVGHFVEVPSSLGRIPNEPYVSRQHMIVRVHNALRYLLRLIPSANSGLAESLRGQFPNHRTATRQGYIAFVKNSLKTIEYAPELKAEIQTLITERLIKLDVEVQEELDDLEDEVDEGRVLGLSGLSEGNEDADDSDDDSDADSDSSSEISMTPEETHLRALRDTVAKLDSVLDLLFSHYTPTFANGKMYEVNDAFEHLISQFSTFVLPTYRSRHTQFLVFHFAQMSQGYAERFAGVLIRLATGRSSATNGSLSAAAYLASFIARGARVSKTLIRTIFTRLGNHLDTLRRNHESACQGPNLSRYGTFYAIAQAMLYIFCFRWRDFIMTPDDADVEDYDIFEEGEPEWLPGIKECLTQAIYSKLNPLKVCAPAIVHQFGAIANHLRFMYVIPLLETNKRLRLSSFRSMTAPPSRDMGAARRENTLSHQSGEAHHQLDAFFPFDPYQLPKSKKWLEGDYMVWRGVPGMQDDDDDEDSSDEDEDEDGFGDIGDDPEYESE